MRHVHKKNEFIQKETPEMHSSPYSICCVIILVSIILAICVTRSSPSDYPSAPSHLPRSFPLDKRDDEYKGAKADFLPSTFFQGYREGYIFKKDSKGLGYYNDRPSEKMRHRKRKS